MNPNGQPRAGFAAGIANRIERARLDVKDIACCGYCKLVSLGIARRVSFRGDMHE